jgi:hypothetical protein
MMLRIILAPQLDGLFAILQIRNEPDAGIAVHGKLCLGKMLLLSSCLHHNAKFFRRENPAHERFVRE